MIKKRITMTSPTIPRNSPHLSMRLPISWLSYLFLESFRARCTKRSGSHAEPYRHSNARPILISPCRSGTKDWLKHNMILLIGPKLYISGDNAPQRHTVPYRIADLFPSRQGCSWSTPTQETITVVRLKMHDLFDNYPHYIAYP